MQCPQCQHENQPGAKFCVECASPLTLRCPACSTEAPPTAKFCPECAAPLAAKPQAAAPAPRSYAPKHLADKILQSKSALEGERKQVTVLFADVKGSMEMAEQLDPEAFSQVMQRFFRILSDGVERFEGFVDKFTGDGIMALFGAPIAHEDHARRACYAALHLRDEIATYATELRRQHGVGFSTRLGINSGEVIVGRIGDDLRMDYTAQGHTVGLAQRMESLAEPNTCFLSAATAQLVAGYFALDDLGEFQVKGVVTPVRVHRLGGIGSSRTRLDVSRARGFSRFVGRGDEMQLLESALARAREGIAQIVGIVGEAGLGKSRLCFEFLERCRARGLMAYETTGVSHGKSIPFLPMLRLFRAFFGITEQDSDATARERIAGRLLLLDEQLREGLPLLFDFMGVADPEHPAPRVDPEARQRQMFDIVRRVVQTRGQKETTVTLIEDLHWFDGGSAAFLEPLIDASVGTRALVLLNFRPEYQAPWMGKSFYQQLPLAPLGPDAIRELLGALLGNDPSTLGLADAIHARTAGNPFFTEEVVQNLIETRKLQGAKGAYKLVTSIDKLEMPGTVHALLAARIDRLAEREKNVLQTAAVIGREFDEPTLAAVVGMEASQLREALQKLKGTEFIREQSLYPVAEYLFKHPLTQEVALTSQLQENRRKLHAAVARVIEAAHAADLDERAALLAHHWEQAADLARAVHWHRRAAEWAGANDPVEGLRHWRKVRELGRSLADAVTKESRFRACKMILAGGTWRLGMSEEDAQMCLDEARELAQAVGRPAHMAVPLAGFALGRGVRGHVGAALAFSQEAHAMLHDGIGNAESLYVLCVHAWSVLLTGHVERAIEALDHIIRRSGGDPQAGREVAGISPTIWADLMAARVSANAGQFDACWVRAERAVRTARELDDQEDFCMAIQSLGICAYLAGGTSGVPVADLRRICVEALEVATVLGNRGVLIAAKWALAIADFLNGDCDIAAARLSESLAEARVAGTGLEWQGYTLAVFADSCRSSGDAEAAIARAREAVALTDAGGFGFQAALGRAALADALVHAGAPAHEVAAVIAAAREIVEETGGNSLLPRLRETEARAAGRNDRAALHAGLREAEAMYRALGAPDPADRLAKEISG